VLGYSQGVGSQAVTTKGQNAGRRAATLTAITRQTLRRRGRRPQGRGRAHTSQDRSTSRAQLLLILPARCRGRAVVRGADGQTIHLGDVRGEMKGFDSTSEQPGGAGGETRAGRAAREPGQTRQSRVRGQRSERGAASAAAATDGGRRILPWVRGDGRAAAFSRASYSAAALV
jgi:hypothetical protein